MNMIPASGTRTKQLGLLFDKLREQGIYDDMAIIISSDHGEDLGEMGSYCEHGEADYITTHIPLIIKWPGCAKNTVSHGFHYNLDLLPTLVDLLGGVPPFTCNPVVGNPTRWCMMVKATLTVCAPARTAAAIIWSSASALMSASAVCALAIICTSAPITMATT